MSNCQVRSAPRQRHLWTSHERNLLLYHLGHETHVNVSEIAQRLGRTVPGVIGRCWADGISLTPDGKAFLGPLQVGRLLGCPAHRISKWFASGIFGPLARTCQIRGRPWPMISYDNLLVWLENQHSWSCWQPENITDRMLREWASEFRAPWLSLNEAAEMLDVPAWVAANWARRGKLTARSSGARYAIRIRRIGERRLERTVKRLTRPRIGARRFRVWIEREACERLAQELEIQATQQPDGVTRWGTQHLAWLLGLKTDTVYAMVKRGNFTGYGTSQGLFCISNNALRAWLAQIRTWHLWQPEKINHPELRDYAQGLRAGWLDCRSACQLLGCSYSAIRRHVTAGHLAPILGGVVATNQARLWFKERDVLACRVEGV